MESLFPDSIIVKAKDEFPLGVSLFGSSRDKVLIIHSATGVSQGFYANFARSFVSRGYSVVTFDYRGTGFSKAGLATKDVKASMSDWMLQDVPAVHAWVESRFPHAETFLVAHSFGGQMLGLIPIDLQKRLKKVVLVATQYAYWRLFAPWNAMKMLYYWYVLYPLSKWTLGYFPMGRMNGGEDLPLGVASECRKWCLNPKYVFMDYSSPEVLKAYRDFPAPILAYDIADDEFAGGSAAERFASYFSSERLSYRKIGPGVGHFGFFTSKFKGTLWKEVQDWCS